MLLSTALLHLAGLAVGVSLKRGVGEWSVRAAGAAVAITFAGLMITELL